MRSHEYMLGCPAHDEKTGSLHVTWQASNRGGFVLLHCFGCQARGEDLVAPLGLTVADLFDEPLPERDRAFGRVGKSPESRRSARRRGHLGRLPAPIVKVSSSDTPEPEHVWVEVARYPYVDLRGELVQEVVREECSGPECERHKQFTQVFVTGEGRKVRRKPQDFFPVLYRAPQVRDAAATGVRIWLLEGEKDVHTAEQLGLVATTNAQGGKSFPDDLIPCLEGAQVTVVLDRDDTGWARGVDLHRKLTAVGAKVALRLPAVEEAKADFTDHVEAGFAVGDLIDVDVAEVATWHQLSTVTAKRRLLTQALAEVDAHLELVSTTSGAAADEHRRAADRDFDRQGGIHADFAERIIRHDLFTLPAVVGNDADGVVHLVVVDADQEGGVPAHQKSAGGCELCHLKTAFGQSGGDRIAVVSGYNGQDHFHIGSAPFFGVWDHRITGMRRTP